MGSGLSRQEMIESRWWEAKAQHMLIKSTSLRHIEGICSLIPFGDEEAITRSLIARSDLEALFARHCKYQKLPGEQSASNSKLTDDSKAKELWRVLRFPLGYRAPWDWDWRPPFSGNPREIANEFYTVVSRAVFRVPSLDFVKYALGYDDKALFVGSLFSAARDVCSSLRRAFQERPETKDIYVKVEKRLRSRYHPLAHWIVASSLSEPPYPLEIALASMLDPIKDIFETCNLEFVLERLAVLDQRLRHVNQRYDWGKWSTDLEFLECVHQALWLENPAIPSLPPQILSEDRDEKLCFLKGFETVPEDEVRTTLSRVLSFVKRLRRVRRKAQVDSYRTTSSSKA